MFWRGWNLKTLKENAHASECLTTDNDIPDTESDIPALTDTDGLSTMKAVCQYLHCQKIPKMHHAAE